MQRQFGLFKGRMREWECLSLGVIHLQKDKVLVVADVTRPVVLVAMYRAPPAETSDALSFWMVVFERSCSQV